MKKKFIVLGIIAVILIVYIGVTAHYFTNPHKIFGEPVNYFMETSEDTTGSGIRILAHRCGSAEGFESSLNAAIISIDNGAHTIDFDLRMTADGVVVVYHDPDMERLTGVNGTVEETNFNSLPTYLNDYNVSFYPNFVYKKTS